MYKYAITNEAGEFETEEAGMRKVAIPEDLQDGGVIDLQDEWQDTSHPSFLLSRSAFRGTILPTKTASSKLEQTRQQPAEGEVIIRFRLWDWGIQDGDSFVVSGSLPQLGNWQQDQPLLLSESQMPFWETEVRTPLKNFPITYKYGLRRKNGDLELEVGENRIMSMDVDQEERTAPALIVRDDGPFRHEKHWRGAAVALPVFCLRTQDSVGVGEFEDIKKLVDVCDVAGLRMIQLLPVNDTGVYNMWWDSYPYSSVSVFALHPLYLSLSALAPKDMPEELAERIQQARVELDQRDVEYEQTLATKLAIAREIFNQRGPKELESADFKAYFEANERWLRPYAVFKFLQGLFGTAEHWHWGSLSRPTQKTLQRLSGPDQAHYSSIQFTYWLQWHLHRQLRSASLYAQQHRIALKGDLPIGVDKRSVDTWMHPHIFHMQFSTGAPPDYFDANGQNWGFPTYNWEEMAKDGYEWWRRRLTTMSQYFHAYRIDHILGFFRIWEIPGDCTLGLLGHFRPSHPITRQELEAHGIWDFDRLCDPYITTTILEDTFGELAHEVASKYLVEYQKGRYHLREEYYSEADIEALQPRPGSPAWLVGEVEAIKQGLLDLRHNVVLLRSPDSPDDFTPRFNLASTTSFASLDPHWKAQLVRLHDDYLETRQLDLWWDHAHTSLPVLMRATDMLVCGEDLGFLAPCVHPLMKALGLVGLRIQRMPSEPDTEFGDPANYPYMCVASPSCHDTSTTRAWYEEDAARRQRFSDFLGLKGTAPEVCTPEVMHAVVQQHVDSPAMWAIFPIQDLLAMSAKYATRPAAEETINNPTVRKHYWRYRCHVELETLLEDKPFLATLQQLLLSSGRVKEQDLPAKLAPRVMLDHNGAVADGH
ncbi:g11744 [Coccomyxa elongata]